MLLSKPPSNKRIQPTPLRGPAIVPFLTVGFGSKPLPIYTAARLMRRPPFGGSIISFERSLIQRSVPQILHHATLTVVPK
jgi:hypothetical protein